MEKDLGWDHIIGGFYHSKPKLRFRIFNNLLDNNSIGFNNLNIHFTNYSGVAPKLCHTSEETFVTLDRCECDLFQATLNNTPQQCQNCAPGCTHCFGPNPNQCVKCELELEWNGQSCSDCHFSCGSCRKLDDPQSCTTCAFGFFRLENNFCVSECNPVAFDVVYDQDSDEVRCVRKCPAGKYSLPDLTCSSSCPSTLIAEAYEGAQFCSGPCPYNYYLSDGGECVRTCPQPWAIYLNDYVPSCGNPCSPQQKYLFADGKCSSECPFPFKVEDDTFGFYCVNPCPKDHFLHDNGVCQETCPVPLFRYYDESGKICTGKEKVSSSSLYNGREKKGPIAAMARFNKYISYLNVPLPENLDDLANSKGINMISLPGMVKMNARMLSAFPKYSIPEVFERRGLHSSFLVNFWSELIFLLIALFCGLLVYSLERLAKTQNWNKAFLVFNNLRILAAHNWTLVLFAIYSDEIILYSILEFRTVHITSFWTFLSFFLALGFFAGVFVFLIGSFLFVRKVHRLKKSDISGDLSSQFVKRFQAIQVLHLALKDKTLSTHLFYVTYCARAVLVSFFAATLHDAPVANATLNFLVSLTIMTYIALEKPIKRLITLAQLMIVEGFFLFTNLIMLIITIEVELNEINRNKHRTLGSLIISGNLAVNCLIFVFLAVKLGMEALKLISFQKNDLKSEKSHWTQLLVVILQQAGMGFEEVKVPSSQNPKVVPDKVISPPISSFDSKKEMHYTANFVESKELSHSNSMEPLARKGSIYFDIKDSSRDIFHKEQLNESILVNYGGLTERVQPITNGTQPIANEIQPITNALQSITNETQPITDRAERPQLIIDSTNRSQPVIENNFRRASSLALNRFKKLGINSGNTNN